MDPGSNLNAYPLEAGTLAKDLGMKFSWIGTCAAMAFLAISIPFALASEESARDDARKAGRAVGSATREVWKGAEKAGKEIGRGAKKVGKEIGHGAQKAGKEIGHGARKVGETVGGAAKEGGREFKRAVSGEK